MGQKGIFFQHNFCSNICMLVVMKGLSIILYFLITLYTDGQMGEGPRSEHEASPMPVLAGHDHVRQKWSEELFCLLSCLAGSASGQLLRPRPVFRSDAASGRP